MIIYLLLLFYFLTVNYSKHAKGKVEELNNGVLIAISLRAFDWPCNHNSEVRYQFAEHNDGRATLLTFQQIGIPRDKLSDCENRWEQLCKDLKKHFSKKV